MAGNQEQRLEEELQSVWKNAANTRKRTADWRIESILKNSRAELSLRELLTFFMYLGQAFFMLISVVAQMLFREQTIPAKSKDKGEQS